MIRSAIGFAALAVALLATGGIGSAPAGAAVVSGSNLAAEPDDETCLTPPEPLSCTIGLSALPSSSRAPGGTRAGISGVIVGWSVRTATNLADISMRLRVDTRGHGRRRRGRRP